VSAILAVVASLAFYVIYDAPNIPAGIDAATEAKLVTDWREYGEPFLRRQIDRFRREMKRGRVVELHKTDHRTFLTDPVPQAVVVREMRKFLLDE